jgi:hypothetical protein
MPVRLASNRKLGLRETLESRKSLELLRLQIMADASAV